MIALNIKPTNNPAAGAIRLQTGLTCTVGSSPAADHSLTHGVVAPIHCRITCHKKTAFIECLQSEWTIERNGVPSNRSRLVHDDRIKVGETEFLVELTSLGSEEPVEPDESLVNSSLENPELAKPDVFSEAAAEEFWSDDFYAINEDEFSDPTTVGVSFGRLGKGDAERGTSVADESEHENESEHEPIGEDELEAESGAVSSGAGTSPKDLFNPIDTDPTDDFELRNSGDQVEGEAENMLAPIVTNDIKFERLGRDAAHSRVLEILENGHANVFRPKSGRLCLVPDFELIAANETAGEGTVYLISRLDEMTVNSFISERRYLDRIRLPNGLSRFLDLAPPDVVSALFEQMEGFFVAASDKRNVEFFGPDRKQ